MAVMKRCGCKGKQQYSCSHDWWVRYQSKGTRKRINITEWSGEQLANKGQAEVVETRLMAAINAGKFNPKGEHYVEPVAEGQGYTFRRFAEFFIDHYVKQEIRGKTYEGTVRMIAEYFGDKPLRAITKVDVDDYRHHLSQPAIFTKHHKVAKKRKKTGVGRIISKLRKMFTYAIEVGFVTETPFRRNGVAVISFPKEKKPFHARILPLEEERLLMALRTPSNGRKPNLILVNIVIMLIESGLRSGELRELRWSDLRVDDEGDILIHVRGIDENDGDEELNKVGKDRIVPATPRFMEAAEYFLLDVHGKIKPADTPIVSDELSQPIGNWLKAFKTAVARASLNPKTTPHWCRHEFGSRHVERGTPLPYIQQWMGHADIKTTMRYVNPTREAMKLSMLGPAATRVRAVLGQFRRSGPQVAQDSPMTSTGA